MPKSPKYDYLEIPIQFYEDEKLLKACIRGIFDTDGSVSFRKGGKKYSYYPIISIASKSAKFIYEITTILKEFNIIGSMIYNYDKKDIRVKKGYTTISTVQVAGHKKLNLWLEEIGTWHSKHQGKILTHGREESKNLIKKIKNSGG